MNIIEYNRGVYPPLSSGSQPPRWSTGIMAWYIMPITSRCVEARRNDQSLNNYCGCKEWKKARWKSCYIQFEKYHIYIYSPRAQTMQWLKSFINTGETLLKIPHPRTHAPQCSSLSLLFHLFNS